MSPPSTYHVGFIDVGFLKGSTAAALGLRKHQLQLDAGAVAAWFSGLEDHVVGLDSFLRAYWYDGAFEPDHKESAAQRKYLDAVGFVPGLQLRLGNISERRTPKNKRLIVKAIRETVTATGGDPDAFMSEFAKQWEWRPERSQKGVDTRIVLDMVRLAQKNVYRTAVLLAGDRDLAEAVRVAQDDGKRVVVVSPRLNEVAKELKQLADHVLEIAESDLRSFVVQPCAPAGSTPLPPPAPTSVTQP